MAWVPSGTPNTIFHGMTAEQWQNIIYGGSLDFSTAPHRQEQVVYACEIVKPFKDKGGAISYTKGMQGQLCEVDEKRKLGKIYIRGVTERDGITHRWVPLGFISRGKRWQPDMNKWNMKIQLPGHYRFDKRGWDSASPPDTSVLGKTITGLITALRNSPQNAIPEKFVEYLEKQHTTVLTKAIIDGIKEAGLYETLASDRSFTGTMLLRSSRYKIRDLQSSQDAGIYARFHTTGDQVGHRWAPRSSYAYVGQTNDFAERNESHKQNYRTSYGTLTRDSEVICMIALCVLPPGEDSGLHYLAEQIFVCMLQTYRSEVLDQGGENIHLLNFGESAKYFTELSEEVFRMTGWQGFIRRGFASCGVAHGANCSSPIFEYAARSEKFLFIRQDAEIVMDSSTVPMAYYRRSDRLVTSNLRNNTIALTTKITVKGEIKKFVHIFFTKSQNQESGVDVPPPGSPYELVFEVRKDGRAHHSPWARLPKIGRFQNWEQASSWAVRIEWEHPINSGKWRFMYVQARKVLGWQDASVPGSLTIYAKAISFLQWLTNSEPNHKHAWIPRMRGKARVMQCDLDAMNQTIVFRSNPDPIRMLPGDIIAEHAIKAQMRKPEYGLRQVDARFGDFGGARVGSRSVCDTCFMIPRFVYGGYLADKGCVQDKVNKNACTNCVLFGRPCCSWTLLPAARVTSESSPDQRAIIQKTQSVLVRLPVAKIPPEMQGFSQQFRDLEDSREADDGEDYNDSEDEDDLEDLDYIDEEESDKE
ncbi:hypothetical protein yc1106_10062 [Curvularia clavata]|uniref:Uncharacterized protein n=1 Tax=Curvularia clavata TaxID=95742 RepID=A0A9Q8ZMK4_CURCL|nr:hypothetical protein yc1106_10062 [Curvularia clavata]